MLWRTEISSISLLLAVEWRTRRSLARKSTAVSKEVQLMYPICSSFD
ncbi:hypothetical protein [Priestia megaterium]|nr:hypothetical protein [Priestia megaterium]